LSSYSSKRTEPVASSLNLVTCAGISHVWNWNGVVRRRSGRPGPLRWRIEPIVVESGATSTLRRCGSLNVFRRHVNPPH
jgi:hypothetical protein